MIIAMQMQITATEPSIIGSSRDCCNAETGGMVVVVGAFEGIAKEALEGIVEEAVDLGVVVTKKLIAKFVSINQLVMTVEFTLKKRPITRITTFTSQSPSNTVEFSVRKYPQLFIYIYDLGSSKSQVTWFDSRCCGCSYCSSCCFS